MSRGSTNKCWFGPRPQGLKGLLMVLAALAALWLAAPPALAQAGLTLWLPAEPDSLDPATADLESSYVVTTQIYETLFSLSPTGELSGLLATDWSYADATRLRIRLARDAVFSDGAPVDAAAVQASLTRLLVSRGTDPALLEAVTAVAVVDDYTVVIQTAEPYAPLMAHLAHPATAIVPGGHGRDLASAPVGSGPYALEQWRPADRLVLRANPHYRGDAPTTQELTFLVEPQPDELLALLRSGDLHLALALPPAVYSALASEEGLVTDLRTGGSAVQLGINSTHPALADLNVRQALALAIDKLTLVDAVPGGLATPAVAALPPTVRLVPEGPAEPYSYEPDAARSMLEQEGLRAASFTLDLPDDPELVSVAEALAGMLAEVGVSLELRVLAPAQFRSQLTSDEVQLFLTRWNTPTFDPDQTLFHALHSATMPTGNHSRYRVAAVDALLQEARNSTSQVVRAAAYADVLETVLTDLPVITLYYPRYAVAKVPALTGEQVGPAWYQLDLRRAALGG